MINLKLIIKIFIKTISILIICLSFNISSASENRIIFKINDYAFTLLDYEKRIKYLDFVSNNNNLDEKIILEDFISTNLFYEYFKSSNKNIDYEDKIIDIFNNIVTTNKKNNKKYNYEIIKEDILINIEKDYIRKTILENILNEKVNEFYTLKNEIDLLYKHKIKYINFRSKNNLEIINKIYKLDNVNIDRIKLILNNEGVNFFIKEKEINDLQLVDKEVKENILQNKNIFHINKNDNISFFLVEKNFETLDGIIFNLYSLKTEYNLSEDSLLCKNILNLNNVNNEISIVNKEYNLVDLNKDLKNNLININDYVKFINNDKNIYVILCEIKFDKEILNNIDLNKQINLNAIKIEKEFINKYSKIYNLIIFDE